MTHHKKLTKDEWENSVWTCQGCLEIILGFLGSLGKCQSMSEKYEKSVNSEINFLIN